MPVVLALSINLIFTKVFQVSIPRYTLFVLSAILPWLFFSQGLSEATNSFLANASALKQGIFPREIVPLSSVLGNFLNFGLGQAIILPLFIAFNPKIILLIPLLALSFVLFLIFLWGLSLIFSSANVFYRDLFYFLSLGLMLWFWITPVFYSFKMLPYPYRLICLINPLTYFISNFRSILYDARVDLIALLASIIISLLFFFAGYSVFLSGEKELLKRV